MKVKTLQDLWSMSEYQLFSLVVSLGIDPKTGIEKLGVTSPNILERTNKNGKTIYRVNEVISLELSKSSFSSYYQLGTTMGHKLVHCIHIINGNHSNFA